MQLSFKIPKVLSTLPKVRPPYYFSYFIYFILLLFHIIIFHISHYFENIYIYIFFFRLLIRLPCGSDGKKSACNVGDLGSIPGLRRSSGEGKGYPLQYSGLENSVDCIVHGVTKSRTRLSEFHYHYI